MQWNMLYHKQASEIGLQNKEMLLSVKLKMEINRFILASKMYMLQVHSQAHQGFRQEDHTLLCKILQRRGRDQGDHLVLILMLQCSSQKQDHQDDNMMRSVLALSLIVIPLQTVMYLR